MLDSIMAVMQDDWVMVALPFFLLALLIEWLWARKQLQPIYEKSDFATSMGIMVLTVFVDIIPKILGIWLMFICYEASPFKDIVTRTLPFWVLLFFLDDFTYYWFHRGNHEVRFMWAGHISHHNSQYYNLGTALRQGVGERVIKYFAWCPLALLGFDPVMIVTMLSLSLIYQYWIHTTAINRMPRWYEFLFNTPSHHRVHHASNIRYLDRNHGATLMIWDRLFGTFSDESTTEPVTYGLTANVDNPTVLRSAFSEYGNMAQDFSRATQWRDKLRYIFLAPGWSHDGPDKRSNTLRREA
jgi:sterol desaturase/sphingolipid hydroxylase (fatty acid hydroxylase superfamily)